MKSVPLRGIACEGRDIITRHNRIPKRHAALHGAFFIFGKNT